MNIALIEENHEERGWTAEELRAQFPAVTISEFKSAGDFFLALENLRPSPDLVITEDRLPLLCITRDLEIKLADLRSKFPEATAGWTHHVDGERILRETRRFYPTIPVILFTYTSEARIHEKFPIDDKFFYCEKGLHCDNLIARIHGCLRQGQLKQ